MVLHWFADRAHLTSIGINYSRNCKEIAYVNISRCYQISPKPSLCCRISSNLFLSFCLFEYSGSSSTLVQVRAVGKISLSAQCLSTTNLQVLRPPMGARSVPVTKKRKDFLS